MVFYTEDFTEPSQKTQCTKKCNEEGEYIWTSKLCFHMLVTKQGHKIETYHLKWLKNIG